jgi:hypothetical protein
VHPVQRLRAGELEGVMVEVELPAKPMDLQNLGGGGQVGAVVQRVGREGQRLERPVHLSGMQQTYACMIGS